MLDPDTELENRYAPPSYFGEEKPKGIDATEPQKQYVHKYLGNLLVYLDEHVERMAQKWKVQLLSIRAKWNVDAGRGRRQFWQEEAKFLRKENGYLRPMIDEIRWCCNYLCRKTYGPKQTYLGFTNVRRRSQYLLLLTLEALCDLRVGGDDDFVYPWGTSHPVYMSPEMQKAAEYASGLNTYREHDVPEKNQTDPSLLKFKLTPFKEHVMLVGTKENRVSYITCQVTVVLPLIYPYGRTNNMCLKLPTHFMDLLATRLKDDSAYVPVPVFRALLAHYALFLARLIWRGTDYLRCFREQWLDADTIFGIPLGDDVSSQLAIDNVDYKRLHRSAHWQRFVEGDSDYKYIGINDINKRDREPSLWHSCDLDSFPATQKVWDKLLDDARLADISTCPKSREGYWLHAM